MLNDAAKISLVVGLGNIGRQYQGSRHNLGFEVIETLARQYRALFKTDHDDYDAAAVELDGRKLVLAKPTTLVNGSGHAVDALLQQHDLEPSQMLIVVDDFNLPLGRLRLRPGGSDGGHNGLVSIIETLQTDDFPRLRLGIGPLPPEFEKKEFVLARFAQNELVEVAGMVASAAEATTIAIQHRFEEAMQRYNVNPA